MKRLFSLRSGVGFALARRHDWSTYDRSARPGTSSGRRIMLSLLTFLVVFPGIAAAAADTLHPQELSSVRNDRSKQSLSAIQPTSSLGVSRPLEAESLRLNPNRRVSLSPSPSIDPLLLSAQFSTTQPLSLIIRRPSWIEGAVDDCTYWYSGEYLAEDRTYNWRTRIGSPDLGQCAETGPESRTVTTIRPHSKH
jgi:hypothetical protein